MGQLVDDLLTFSRLGRTTLGHGEINMTALAQSTFDAQVAIARPQAVDLHLQSLAPARGDRAMLEVVFCNLFSNAIKFSRPRNPIVIDVTSRQEGGFTIYQVTDNGVGFDMRYVHKLFDVFQRLHSPSEFEGTGVGLALVQRVVQRHGGRVWGESVVGQGASLSFSLPIAGGES